jgi:hypothetical protein
VISKPRDQRTHPSGIGRISKAKKSSNAPWKHKDAAHQRERHPQIDAPIGLFFSRSSLWLVHNR